MAGRLACIKGKFIMSINDTPEIREVFAAFILDEVRLTYTVGRQAFEQKARELIISNADAPAGLL
jgi:DNA adenine methylase